MNERYQAVAHIGAGQQTPSQNAALLIDFDNVTMAIRSNLAAELRKLLDSDIIRGKVSVQRAYADWRRYPQYVVPLSEASIDLIFAPAYGSTKKNATDIRLAIDALEIVFTRPEIGTFILLSGDSDFSSMVLKLKEYGKYVIGVGLQESASDLLVQNCDEYYSYSSLSGLTSFADMHRESLGPWELCERALQRMVERGDVMRSDRMKQVMIELDPSFDEKALGFTKYNKYLAEAASRGLITLRKLENGQFEVGAPAQKALITDEGAGGYAEGPAKVGIPTEAPTEKRSRGGRGRGRRRSGRSAEPAGRAAPDGEEKAAPGGGTERTEDEPPRKGASGNRLRDAYNLLRDVVASASPGGGGVRDSEVKREMLKRQPGFDESELGFSKFSRFLTQAHDEEIANVEKADDGNLQIAPLDGGPGERPDSGRERRERKGRRGKKPGAKRAQAADRPAPESASEETEGDAEAASADAEAREPVSKPTRGVGYRRGSRGVPGEPPPRRAGAKQKPESTDDGSSSAQADLELDSREADSDRPSKEVVTRPASLSRFRRGARARGAASTPAAARGVPDAGSDTKDAAPAMSDAVEHMVRNYKGVGRKTAETLAQELGADLLDVIDSNPDRIRAILPGRRAEAVIAGRAAEREQG